MLPPNTCFLGTSRVQTQTASRSVWPFLHSSPQRVPIIYNGPPFPLKIENCPSHEEYAPHLRCDSLSPAKSSTQTLSRSVQPIFAGLTTVTDTLTDRQAFSNTLRIRTYLLRCGMKKGNYCVENMPIQFNWLHSSLYVPVLLASIPRGPVAPVKPGDPDGPI